MRFPLPRFVAILALALISPWVLPWVQPETARAAGLAQEHTVLYYLIEMQRRAKRTCNGRTMPEAPSLMPSEALRALARESAATGRPVQSPDGTAVFTASTFGRTPQQAVNNLTANQCAQVMDANLHYIGAFSDQGNWTVVMTATDPAHWVPDEAFAPAPGPTLEPGVAPPFRQEEAPPESAPRHAGQAGQAQTASPGPQSARKPGEEPTEPASPLILGEMQLDYQGNPVGPLLPPTPAPLAGAGQASPQTPDASGASPGATPPRLGRPGVTPLHDERQTPLSGGGAAFSGTGSLPSAHSAPPEPALQPSPGTPPRPGQGWSAAPAAPLAAQPSAPAQDRIVPLVPGGETQAPGLRSPSTLPVRIPASAAVQADLADMLASVNALRAKGASCAGTPMRPVPALKADPTLAAAAQAHAADMASRRYFSSTTPDGRTLGRRLSDAGYGWGFVAENIAGGSDSVETILGSWLADDRQCRNLMGAQYSQTGVGFSPDGKLWVFTLAAPMQDGTLRLR